MQHLIFIPGQVSLLKTGEHISKGEGDREAVSRVCVCVFVYLRAGWAERGWWRGRGEGRDGHLVYCIVVSAETQRITSFSLQFEQTATHTPTPVLYLISPLSVTLCPLFM